MLIENILDRPGTNPFLDAGQLNEQIASDFEDLAARLETYQTDHLDAKCKGLTHHYEDWSASNRRKIQYARQVAMLARLASDSGGASFTREAFEAMDPGVRHAELMKYARRLASKVGPYDPASVYVERQSMHPEDWYLWTVAACRPDTGEWSVWTMNVSTGGLSGGVYNVKSMHECNKAIARKKNALEEKRRPSARDVERAEAALHAAGVDQALVRQVLSEISGAVAGIDPYPKESE